MGVFHTLLRPWYLNPNIILPSQTFYVIAFLLYICITILLLLRYIICFFLVVVIFPFFFSFRLCIILLQPFGYLSPSLSISPFQFSLALPFYYLRAQLVFSHLSVTSFHLISVIFIFFPFQATIFDKGLSPKRLILNFFSKFSYFALGSLIS